MLGDVLKVPSMTKLGEGGKENQKRCLPKFSKICQSLPKVP